VKRQPQARVAVVVLWILLCLGVLAVDRAAGRLMRRGFPEGQPQYLFCCVLYPVTYTLLSALALFWLRKGRAIGVAIAAATFLLVGLSTGWTAATASEEVAYRIVRGVVAIGLILLGCTLLLFRTQADIEPPTTLGTEQHQEAEGRRTRS